ncbi:MAG: alginate export family protein [Bacteroidetes bacterium]|nr:alginate export family protein [Bacteroidota bacterium]MCW5896738.1 alginate export family protein [Bacteroidota bacterium]
MRLLAFFLLLAAVPASSQDFSPSFRWMGDIRIRSEVDMRDCNQRTHANTYTLLRTRLGLEARPLEDVRILIQARDSRVFGQETSTLSDSRNLDLHQGYVELTKLFLDELTLRLGRQELSYGNERMVGTVGWHNVGRVFDGGLARFDIPSFMLDLFAMNTGEVQPYAPVATPPAVQPVSDEGSNFFGSYLSIKNIPEHTVSGYLLYEWNRSLSSGATELQRFTAGSHVKGKANALDYECEFAYQGGKRRATNISAYMLTGGVGYSFEGSVFSRVAAGYELLSGLSGGTTYKSFDPAFHTGHKFYGYMDYFINIPAQTLDRGLTDLMIRSTITPSEKLSLNIWFHHFAYHQSIAGQRTLGQEIDVVLTLRYNRNVNFEVGTSVFLPASAMRQRFNGSDAAFWGYLLTMVTF